LVRQFFIGWMMSELFPKREGYNISRTRYLPREA
jgi:hypothetical protein